MVVEIEHRFYRVDSNVLWQVLGLTSTDIKYKMYKPYNSFNKQKKGYMPLYINYMGVVNNTHTCEYSKIFIVQ